jgi:hypothetical protein
MHVCVSSKIERLSTLQLSYPSYPIKNLENQMSSAVNLQALNKGQKRDQNCKLFCKQKRGSGTGKILNQNQ